MLSPRRMVLDALLTDAAAEGGAEVRLGFTVKDLLWEDGRVVGIRGRDASGAVVEERATITIGADGQHSAVARAVGAVSYAGHSATTVVAYSYWRGIDLDAAEIFVRPDRFVVGVPTDGGQVCIALVAPIAEAPRWRADLPTAVADTFAHIPHLGDRVARAERVERFRLTADTAAFLRVPHGPGWALVGDAAHHVDPITAQGMLDAFRDADTLSAAIDDGLTAGSLPAALAARHRERDAAVMPMHEFTAGLAHVEQSPPPDVQALIGVAATDPALTSRFLGIIAGSTRVEEFLSPTSLDRILGRTATAAA
jgi:flavin-dependent dehydrogenase